MSIPPDWNPLEPEERFCGDHERFKREEKWDYETFFHYKIQTLLCNYQKFISLLPISFLPFPLGQNVGTVH
jgi:hypothetical protein